MSDQQDPTSAAPSGPSSVSAPSTSASVNVQQLKSQIANRFQAHRPLIVKLHSVLTWEQDIYAAIVFGTITFFFIVLHLMNSSLLTTFSYLGIISALLDLAMPTVFKKLALSQTKPSDKDNQRFDKICQDLAKLYATSKGFCDYFCSLKTKNPKFYYAPLLGVLLLLAYLGNKINNLFLTYLVTLFVALYPGLEKKRLIPKVWERVQVALGRRPSTVGGSGAGDRRSGKKN